MLLRFSSIHSLYKINSRFALLQLFYSEVYFNVNIEQSFKTIHVLIKLDCLKPKQILNKTIDEKLSSVTIINVKSSSRFWLESYYSCNHYVVASLLA